MNHERLDRWGRLLAEAARHRGVVTVAMAAAVGISRTALHRRAMREGWTRIVPGAWAVPGTVVSHEVCATAQLLLLGERAVLGHASAANLHGLTSNVPARPELVVPMDRRANGRGGAIVRRSRTLVAADVTEVRGLRATRVARTSRDLAATATWDEVYDLVTDAEQRRLVTYEECERVAERLAAGPGGSRFASVVETRRRDRSDSAIERDTRVATRDAGFAPSDGPFPVRVAGGRRLWLDVAFPVAWFGIECDGFGFHASRMAFERDRDRWRLLQRAGWRITWVTRRRLRDDLTGLLEEVAEAHRIADPARAPAVPAV